MEIIFERFMPPFFNGLHNYLGAHGAMPHLFRVDSNARWECSTLIFFRSPNRRGRSPIKIPTVSGRAKPFRTSGGAAAEESHLRRLRRYRSTVLGSLTSILDP